MVKSLEIVGKTSTWLKAILEPNRTLLVIDMQVKLMTNTSTNVDDRIVMPAKVDAHMH